VALLRETGSSCLLVTHDPAEAMGIADRIFLMRQGRLVQTGTPQQIYRQPVDIAAARFFSECSEIQGLARHGEVATPIGSFRSPEGVSDGPVSVLLRPQALQIADGPIGLEGYILESRFEGAEAHLDVLFKGIEKPLSARVPARHLPRSGETAVFAVDSDHVLVFARAAPDPT
jgi:iron(III) transport system ATP-binding protein